VKLGVDCTKSWADNRQQKIFSNGWRNPYLYDGEDGVRYDGETALYWMSVRAYDPAAGHNSA
jgi:hypothetical protein